MKITDRTTGELLYERNVVKEDHFQSVNDHISEWSQTGRYLTVKDRRSDQVILIDVEARKIVSVPLENWFSILWSDDDARAIVTTINPQENASPRYLSYIWDIANGVFQYLGDERRKYYKWSPNNQLYAIDFVTIDDSAGYKVMRYSMDDQKWEEIYRTTKSIDYDSFQIIDDEHFIYVGHGVNKTKNPFYAFTKPIQDYIVKVNSSDGTEKVRKLDAYLIKVVFWSDDHQTLYYQDVHGFFQAKADF